MIAFTTTCEFNKPVKLRELTHAIDKLLASRPNRPRRVLSKFSLSLEIPKSTSSMTTIRFAGR